jgi:hypothetical protein
MGMALALHVVAPQQLVTHVERVGRACAGEAAAKVVQFRA